MITVNFNIDELICPFTLQILNKPVIANDGVTYEFSAIRNAIRYRKKSHITGKQFNGRLIENKFMKNIISNIIKNNPELENDVYNNDYINHRDFVLKSINIIHSKKNNNMIKCESNSSDIFDDDFCPNKYMFKSEEYESNETSETYESNEYCELDEPSKSDEEMDYGLIDEYIILEHSKYDIIDMSENIFNKISLFKFDIISYLINNLININALDNKNKTPIFYIIKYCNPKIIIQFINKYPNIDFNIRDVKGRSILHHICRYSKANILHHILTKKILGLNVEDKYGYKPIHLCIIYNYRELKYMTNYINKESLSTYNVGIIQELMSKIYSCPKLIRNIFPVLMLN